MHKPIAIDFATRITALWTVFLLGTLFHTQLALMPLFHGLTVAESHTHSYISVTAVMWFMLIFFCLPLLAIAGCAFYSSRQFRQLHFGMTLMYTVLNLLHFVLAAPLLPKWATKYTQMSPRLVTIPERWPQIS